MAASPTPTLDEYWDGLAPRLQPFSPDERWAALALYRELAKGHPVDHEQLARALDIFPEEAAALLRQDSIKSFVYPDDQGRVVGFGGLATVPMHHRFEVGGRVLSTWCAWDSLFIPEILGLPAQVTSADPESGGPVRLVVTPDRIERADPAGAVVSFILPDAPAFNTSAANVMAKFCHFVFFFSSPASGKRWTTTHPGTFVYTLNDAFALAKRLNAHNFGAELMQARAGT